MYKTVVWSIALILVSVLIGFYIYSQNTHYYIQSIGRESDNEKAIELAKKSHALGSNLNVDTQIKNWIRDNKGNINKIYGWGARKIDEQTYFVSYTLELISSGRKLQGGYVFEVDLMSGNVLNISGNPALEKKYGLKLKTL
jgi:hypothetical protein